VQVIVAEGAHEDVSPRAAVQVFAGGVEVIVDQGIAHEPVVAVVAIETIGTAVAPEIVVAAQAVKGFGGGAVDGGEVV
jgi:hypothetical protein